MNFSKLNTLYDDILSGVDATSMSSKELLALGRLLVSAYKNISVMDQKNLAKRWIARATVVNTLTDEFLAECEGRMLRDPDTFGASQVISLAKLIQDILNHKEHMDAITPDNNTTIDDLQARLEALRRI